MISEKTHPNILQSLVYVLILILLEIGYFTLLYSHAQKISSWEIEILKILGKLVYFLPLILVLIIRSGVNLKEQVFIPKLTYLVLTVFLSGFLFFGYFFFAYPENHISDFKVSLSFFGMIILTPIFEEVFYRGLILHQLLKGYNVLTAILYTSFLFAISHLNVRIIFPLFLFSILVSYLYIKSKQSLIIAILAHIVWNLLVEMM